MAPLFQTLTFFLFLISQVSAATTFYRIYPLPHSHQHSHHLLISHLSLITPPLKSRTPAQHVTNQTRQTTVAITDRTGKALLTNPSTVKTAPRQAVQISSLAWTSSRPIDAASGLPSGKLKISGLTINRTADANSPLILLQEMTNSVLRTAVVSAMVRK